jgi:hypothetical protein
MDPRTDSDRVLDALAPPDPSPPAGEVKTEAADGSAPASADEVTKEVTDGSVPASADEVSKEITDGSAAAAEPAAASGATEAPSEGFAADKDRAAVSSVSDQKMDFDEGGALGGDHSAAHEASKVNGGGISGEVNGLAPVTSEAKMEVDDGGVVIQEHSAAVVVNEVNVQNTPQEVQDLAPVVSESKMEVDDARILEKESATVPAESKIKMEGGDGSVLDQDAPTPAAALLVKQEAGECLVGRYSGKTVSRHGRILIGKVASYDGTADAYNVVFEDGHADDLALSHLQQLLMAEENGASGMKLDCKKRKLDLLVSSGGVSEVKARPRTRQRVAAGQMSTRPDASQQTGSGSDMSEHTETPSDPCPSAQPPCPPVQPVELPPSSRGIAAPEESISYLFSVYNFLRSFSVQLFLSPFGLDDFVAAINCTAQNNLLDAVHVSLLRALGRCLETKSAQGSQSASNCLKYMPIFPCFTRATISINVVFCYLKC